MGHLSTIKKDKHLWGVTALFLASKYDELDKNIPFIKEFGHVSSRAKYSYREITKCEAMFLDLLNWDLVSLWPKYFMSAILSFGIFWDSDKIDKRRKSCFYSQKEKVKKLNKFAEFFMDIAFQSLELQEFKFSIQASAAIIAARKIQSIKPLWSQKLEKFTKYKFCEVKEWYEKLYAKYLKHFSKYTKEWNKKEKENNLWDVKGKTKK